MTQLEDEKSQAVAPASLPLRRVAFGGWEVSPPTVMHNMKELMTFSIPVGTNGLFLGSLTSYDPSPLSWA